MRFFVLFSFILLLFLPLSAQSSVDKSGVKPNVLSLPSGPGSIEGLGESFAPQLNSGTSSYQVPLAVPPGRNGFAPELALTYNSGSSNSPFGLGWSLALPSIQRQTDKGLPLYTLWPNNDGIDNDKNGTTDEYDEFDTLIYSSGEEILPVSETVWRLKNETSFLRIERLTTGWKLTQKNGVILKFGQTAAAQVVKNNRIFRWQLEEMTDPNGNRINFFYKKYGGAAYSYLTSIQYNSDSTETKYMEVRFQYEARPDIITDYRPGFLLKTAYRCSSIAMYATGTLIRSYRLNYAPTSSVQPFSLLSSVVQVGRDTVSELPPAAFTYTQFNGAAAQPQTAVNSPNLSIDDPNIDLIDLNGDALPDILDTNQQPNSYYFNQGLNQDGRVQWGAFSMMQSSIGLYLNAPTTRLADMDGDGRSDIVNVSSSTVLYHKVGKAMQWESARPIVNAGFSFLDQNIAELDADNDKQTDIMQTAGSFIYVWLNRTENGWSQRFTEPSPDPQQQLDLDTVQLADMNGDRLLDLVHISPGTCFFYPGMGFGRFGEKIRMNNPPVSIPEQNRLFLVDVNSDGQSDAVYLGNEIQVWLNLGLNTADHSQADFAAPFSVSSPYLNAFFAPRQADINGNGSRDIIWNTDLTGGIDLVYLDFTTQEKPYQLKTISNGTGRTTEISYSSSVQEMLRDAANGRPWPENVPLAVPVVSAVAVDDGLGHTYQRTFSYHDGYYDGKEKEFRGFAKVEQLEEGDSSIAGLMTVYQFDTGITQDSLKGKILTQETKNTDDEVFYRENLSWETKELLAGAGGETRSVTFPYLTEKVREVAEKSTDPIQQKWEYQYDDYGNTIRELDYGRLDPGWDDERLTVSSYTAAHASGQATWILDRLVEQTISDENGIQVSGQRNYYDELDLGQVSKGNLTKTEDWIRDQEWQTSIRNAYDAYGNIIAIYDGLYPTAPGHYREIVYDTLLHTFPEQEILHTGNPTVPSLSISATYDIGFGKVQSSTDPNNHTTLYSYDTFGRTASITKPGDSLPTESYDYVLGHDLGNGKTVNWVEVRKLENSSGSTLDARIFYDGLGRKIMTRAEGEFPGQVVVADTVIFNSRKLAWKKYLPYFEENSSLAYRDPSWNSGFSEYRYDALGRVVRTAQPAGPEGTAFSTVQYAPFSRTVQDEEQTDPASPHYGCSMRYVEDGLQDKDGKGRLRETYELVKLDDSGNLLETPVAWKTRYSWNLLDKLTGYIDAQNNQKSIAYDGLGRKTVMHDPDRGTTRYTYDGAGNLIRTVDAKEQAVRYTYDGLNRLAEEYYGDEAVLPAVEYHYDVPAGPLDTGDWWQGPAPDRLADALLRKEAVKGFDLSQDGNTDAADAVKAARLQQQVVRLTAENTKGQLAWIKDQAGEEHNSYDSRGRAQWQIRRIKSSRSEQLKNFFTGMEYDSMDRISRLTYPDQTTVSYQFNSRGLLEAVLGIINAYDYNPAGQNKSLSLAAGLSVSYEYDHRLRLTHLHTRRNDNLLIQDLSYSYDRVSNITGITDQRTAADLEAIGTELGLSAAAALRFSNTQDFVYDSLYRLTRAENPSVYGTLQYRYDRIGNMVHKDASTLLAADPLMDLGAISSGGTAGTWNRIGRNAGDQPGPHAVSGTSGGPSGAMSFAYDDNGNMTRNRDMTLSWDYKNRMTGMRKDGVLSSYLYDYADTRKRKISTDTTGGRDRETMYVDKFSEVRKNRLQKYVYAGTSRVARSAQVLVGQEQTFAAETYFLHDHLGSTALSLDAQGRVTEQMVNYPFGQQRLASRADVGVIPADYTFTGKETDAESGLQYFEARYYDGVLGKFLSVDPLYAGVIGLKKMKFQRFLQHPHENNFYSYATDSPINFVDPAGLATIFIHGYLPFGRRTPFMGHFRSTIKNKYKEALNDNGRSIDFKWSGKHNLAAMKESAKELKSTIDQIKLENPNEKINIIAYSDGGNVALGALSMGANIDNLVTIATPVLLHFVSYKKTKEMLSNGGGWYNIYSKDDAIKRLFATNFYYAESKFATNIEVDTFGYVFINHISIFFSKKPAEKIKSILKKKP